MQNLQGNVFSQDCSVECACSAVDVLQIETCTPFTCEGECLPVDDLGSICGV